MSSVKDSANKPQYWRSIAEYENDPSFLEFVRHEFAAPFSDAEPSSKDRRRFLQLMAASFALAGAPGCRWQEDKLLPLSRNPEGMIPGVPNYYNTTMEHLGRGIGLTVKSFDGRPIKVEGNPEHPDSLGAAGTLEQASPLGLYDPDRSQSPQRIKGGKAESVPLAAAEKALEQHFAGLRGKRGEGLRVLAGRSASPTLTALRERFLGVYPSAQWIDYEPISDVNARAGSVLAFGKTYRAHYAFDRADVVLSLDSDLLGSEPESIANSREFARRRTPETGRMIRLYAVESALSITGSVADHRLALGSELVRGLAVALYSALTAKLSLPEGLTPPGSLPDLEWLKEPRIKAFFDQLVKDLLSSPGRSIVTVGMAQPPEVHALVHHLNFALANAGQTVLFTEIEPFDGRGDEAALRDLAKDIGDGKVSTLLVLDSNPVYTAPADLDFAALLAKVETSVHLGLYLDETGRASGWHIPMAHYLESWGDSRASNGTISLRQPLIAPLYGGRSAIELIAALIGGVDFPNPATREGQALVRSAHAGRIASDREWRKAVHDGLISGTKRSPVIPEPKPLAPLQVSAQERAMPKVENGALELRLMPDTRVFDGRYANNGWLMELPCPITKLTWDNAAWIHPLTAAKLGVQDGTLVELSVGGRSLTVPALMVPGQAPNTVSLALGYGRTAAGRVAGHTQEDDDRHAEPVGVNAYRLRAAGLWFFGTGLTVRATGKKYPLATTQDTHAIDQIGQIGTQRRLPALVREATLSEYKADPNFVEHVVHHPPLLSLWEEPITYDGNKWGLTVDLNKCTGCSACVVACQAENNIPVVGKDRVLMGREMHWIRIDRYYKGDPSEPKVTHQPVMCQHCEHAPCEQVCPVGATVHNAEGLNEMTYNRCIGTRYCSNNCPYKVRRFNYFNFHEDMKDPTNQVKGMVFNPEVTVRSRGVMEKCTYCVQRINIARIHARNEGRTLKDGEIQTACQQTCPTEAIVFGDLNDQQSRVTELAQRPRSYSLLQELNVRPRTRYLAIVRNPSEAG